MAAPITVTGTDGPDPATIGVEREIAVSIRWKFCRSLPGGCYAISFRPHRSWYGYVGTLRVDRSAPDGGPDDLIVSGDLYRDRFRIFWPPIVLEREKGIPIPDPGPLGVDPSAAAVASNPIAVRDDGAAQIPVFPRASYTSYLKGTAVSAPWITSRTSPCTVSITLDQFDYTQPPSGSFTGSFPTAPSRSVQLELEQSSIPAGSTGPVYSGRWLEGGVDKGTVSLTWVSAFFRRASLEIDTLTGAVAPEPVPDGSGGTEYFDTIYAKHGWDLSVVRDETNIPVPAGIVATNCWASGDLHNLMTAHRQSADLDSEWRIHLIVVPAQLGCSRGIMYDQIGVPREGCASFSDDGYPTSDSANFGAAANQTQRTVPRAFLRSATHEVTHTFNQIHQEQETSADNSIMTTTPSVADVLGGPATGAPGVFPDQINLAVNTTVRHHLNHMPDPVIRPGGWPFGAWFGANVPQAADRLAFDPDELTLTVSGPGRVAYGQPVDLAWTLTNAGAAPLVAPNDVSLAGLMATIRITEAGRAPRAFRPFVILCDAVKLATLEPGASVSAEHKVFWSSDGFAFPRPGLYTVTVEVSWSALGVPVGVADQVDVFVDFPASDADNHAAGLVLNREVGVWVALGGNAYHLTEATRRLTELADTGAGDADDADGGGSGRPKLLAGFEGILPDQSRVADGAGNADGPGGATPKRRKK